MHNIREICNSKWFDNKAIILFLNKKDLFQEKIKNVDLSNVFPDYKGGSNYQDASYYIEQKFLLQNKNPNKVITSPLFSLESNNFVGHIHSLDMCNRHSKYIPCIQCYEGHNIKKSSVGF